MVAKGFQTEPERHVAARQELQLQKTAIDALLKVAPDKADA